MKTFNYLKKYLTVLQALKAHTSSENPLSYNELMGCIPEEERIDRRSFYKIIKELIDLSFPIKVKQEGRRFTYFYQHFLSTAQLWIVVQTILDNPSFSIDEKKEFLEQLKKEVPFKTINFILPNDSSIEKHFGSGNVLSTITLLLEAIKQKKKVQFQYFDYTIKKEKNYRKKRYELSPYALLTNNQKYYCVFYSDEHQSFANYRIDKIDHLIIIETPATVVPFDQTQWKNQSFFMYAGKYQTITVSFHEKIMSQMIEQFDQQMIVSKYENQRYQASIKTAISPAILFWLLQFQNDIKILSPIFLQEEIRKIAHDLLSQYSISSQDA